MWNNRFQRFVEPNESTNTVHLWCQHFITAVNLRQGAKVARCLNLSVVAEGVSATDSSACNPDAFESWYETRYVSPPNSSTHQWTNGLKTLITAVYSVFYERNKSNSVVRHGYIVAQLITAVNTWIDLYRMPQARPLNWMVPGLVVLLSSLTAAGMEADQMSAGEVSCYNRDDSRGRFPLGTTDDQLDQSGSEVQQDSPTEFQQQALNAIRQHIGKFRGDSARQGGYVVLMSESIQSCMALGNIQMASAFLKTVESSVLDLSRVPRGPLVSFRYFLGKLYLQQEKFKKADEALAWAFSNCPSKNRRLRRRILESLVAVRLRLGYLPPKQLLEDYNLHHYSSVVTAMKTGNVKLFDDVINNNTSTFVQEGTLLCVEKVKFIVYRTLFRRVLDWCTRELFEGKFRPVVPLGPFTAAFKWQLSDDIIEFDEEEMACIASNIIKLGFIKGYIAWEHGKLVLSKQNPLPRIADCVNVLH